MSGRTAAPVGTAASTALLVLLAVLATGPRPASAATPGTPALAPTPTHAAAATSSPSWPESFTLARVVAVGDDHPALSRAELQAMAAPFLHRPLRALDVEDLRQRVTQRLVDRGWVNSGALVDADALQGDTLQLRLVTGRVQALRVRGQGRLHGSYLASRLLAPGDALDTQLLQQRFQLLLADPLFDRVNVRLLPGARLGEAVLDVDVAPAPTLRATLLAHNQGAPAVGSAVAGVELLARNLSGWGDTASAVLSRSGGSDHVDLGWQLPLAARSPWLQLRYARGNASVVEEPLDSLDIASRVTSREAGLGWPVLNTVQHRLVLGATWAARDNRTTLGGLPFSFVAGEDSGQARVQAWRWWQELTLRGSAGVLGLRSSWAAGRSNVPTDSPVPGAPAARYRLWQGQAQASLPWGSSGAELRLRASAQHSRQALVSLEQFSLGGRHSVRGYRENTLVRDNGWALSAEGLWPLLGGDGTRRLALLPFVDAGAGHQRGGPQQRLASAGLGLQLNWDALEAELFYARRLQRRPVNTHGDLQDHGLHLSLRWRVY